MAEILNDCIRYNVRNLKTICFPLPSDCHSNPASNHLFLNWQILPGSQPLATTLLVLGIRKIIVTKYWQYDDNPRVSLPSSTFVNLPLDYCSNLPLSFSHLWEKRGTVRTTYLPKEHKDPRHVHSDQICTHILAKSLSQLKPLRVLQIHGDESNSSHSGYSPTPSPHNILSVMIKEALQE